MDNTAYATPAHLIAKLAGDPNLTDARAQELVNEAAITVDAALVGAGYTAPATDERDILLIRKYLLNGAAAEAWRELYAEDTEQDRVTGWANSFQTFLKMISGGTIRLAGQSTAEGGGLRVGRLTWKRTPPSTSEWG